MLLERAVNLQETLFRNALPQYFFPADVSDDVERYATQRRTQRCHHDVKQESPTILINICRHDRIDRHAQQCAVCKADGEDAPYPEYLQQAPDPYGITRQDVRDRFQRIRSRETVSVRDLVRDSRRKLRLREDHRYQVAKLPCQTAKITSLGKDMRKSIYWFFLLLSFTGALMAQEFDVVIEGGRVIDPETSLDAVRNVGISGGRITRISSDHLSGKRVVHATGLVVSPGFIDLHQHGQEIASQRVKAFDGVTTALEMEIGVPDVSRFLKMKEGHSLIHYGTTASHVAARALVLGAPLNSEVTDPKTGIPEILPKSGPATNQPATPEQIAQIQQRLRQELEAGALGIGMGIQYVPGATRLEVIDMFRVAAERGLPVYTHMRSFGRTEPGSDIEATEEVIGAAAITGAPLHIVHINSTCLLDSLECLSMVAGARARGLDVTTEAYPYVAGMTTINSAVFNDGWRERLGIDYSNLVIPDTNEHLTRERFEELHNSSTSQSVLIFANTQEMVDAVIPNPLVMIASDGAPGHPRNAGTYSRVLAQYVREKRLLTLIEALRKMTLMPAEMLERSTPAARQKGRLQEGADADIVVFDPQTIGDRATFEKPMEPSVGVRYLLVAGTLLIDDGKMMENVFPGRALVGPAKNLKTQP
jgi:N-acyl-D-aspartate/D-glutamate deacylase